MLMRCNVSLVALALFCGSAHAQGFALPPEITPEIRRACESDVRRHCISASSTLWSVRSCVLRKLGLMNRGCVKRLAEAGLITAQKVAQD
jgi:hypothetical protein